MLQTGEERNTDY